MDNLKKMGARRFNSTVDFGCGTGRLTIPLVKYSNTVIGLDVSEAVINEAKKNTPSTLKNKVSYRTVSSKLDGITNRYDFVHSYIVMQHIPVKKGLDNIDILLEGLDNGSYAAIHVTYKFDANLLKKVVVWVRNHFLLARYLLNVIKGSDWNSPRMRMYIYDIGDVIDLFKSKGINDIFMTRTKHGDYTGIMMMGQKIILQ